MAKWHRVVFASGVLFATSACGGAAEAPRATIPLLADGSGLEPVTTDLGYGVELTVARLAVRDFAFLSAGEVHASWLRSLVLPRVHAHPGHFQGGEVTGELLGRFVVDFLAQPAQTLGAATLLGGRYESANFTLTRASADEAAPHGEALASYTAELRGTAARDGRAIAFTALIESPEGRLVHGVPLDLAGEEEAGSILVLRLLTRDPKEQDTLFDGLDFAALVAEPDGSVLISQTASTPAYEQLRRTFQTHEHFEIVTRSAL